MKVGSHFQDVDQLIAKAKLVEVKNRTRPARFATIDHSPQPDLTSWGKLVECPLYYAKNLPKVKAIVDHFKGSGALIAQEK